MSQFGKKTQVGKPVFVDDQQVFEEMPKLGVKDTDFLLKIVMRSTFEGTEVELAYNVLSKLTKMHRRNLES